MRMRGRRKENEKKKKEREFQREKAKKKSENVSKLQRQSTPEQNSCDVPAPLNHLKTTVVEGARSIFAPTVVSRPDQKHFPKMLPGRS